MSTTTQTAPASVAAHGALVDHPGSGKVLFFASSGNSGATPIASTYTFDGTAYTKYTGVSPPPRLKHSMAHDGANVVLFGGKDHINYLGDCWSWTGTAWQKNTGVNPAGREGHAMSYLSGSTHIIMFGGKGQNGFSNESWVFTNAGGWVKQNTVLSTPTARVHSGIASSAASTILFGGYHMGGYLQDTFSWNGTAWTRLNPTTKPSARAECSMAYDTVNSQYVMFGGKDNANVYSDTWVYVNNNWVLKTMPISATPPARSGASLAFDSTRNQITLFGGYNQHDALNDTWVLNAGTTGWTQL